MLRGGWFAIGNTATISVIFEHGRFFPNCAEACMASANSGHVALVTGSGRRRVGSFVAEALAARGYSLAIHYNHSAVEAEAAVEAFCSPRAGSHRLPSRFGGRTGAVARLVEQVVRPLWQARRPGQLRADLGAEEARGSERKPTSGGTLKSTPWRRFYAANRPVWRWCGSRREAAIVTFGDWAEARPYLNYAAYFASKGAVVGITRSLAVELAARNPSVRVNCILPGPVLLPADLPEAERRRAIWGTLLKREGRPENIVQAVLHFIDNDFVTGACLPVDGGRTLFSEDE